MHRYECRRKLAVNNVLIGTAVLFWIGLVRQAKRLINNNKSQYKHCACGQSTDGEERFFTIFAPYTNFLLPIKEKRKITLGIFVLVLTV